MIGSSFVHASYPPNNGQELSLLPPHFLCQASRSMTSKAINRGSEYLIGIQQPNGLWQDYELPVGPSDEWVTGFAGLALSEISNLGYIDARPELALAALTLSLRERYSGGWGYNSTCKADTDSTSIVIQFFEQLGWRVNLRSRQFVASHWRPQYGGFATYDGPLAWGTGHWDVTPYALLSVSLDARKEMLPVFLNSLAKHRDKTAGWRSYWWSSNLYSSLVTLEALSSLNAVYAVLPFNDFLDHKPCSAFELACLLGIAHHAHWSHDYVRNLMVQLLDHQLSDGSWEGSPQLRLTEPVCYEPWLRPNGNSYVDVNSVITTAIAIRVLAKIGSA